MGGMFGVGGSSQKTDRNSQLAQWSNLQNIFNQGMGIGQTSETQGQAALGQAGDYWKRLLTAGRTDTAARSAPAIGATLAQSDAARRQAGAAGTSRTGGSAAVNREAGQGTAASIDTIINQNLMGGQEKGAEGLANVGTAELGNALSALGLSESASSAIMENATKSRTIDPNPGKAIGSLLGAWLMGGGGDPFSSGGGGGGGGGFGDDMAEIGDLATLG